MIETIDHSLGRIFDALQRLGLAETRLFFSCRTTAG